MSLSTEPNPAQHTEVTDEGAPAVEPVEAVDLTDASTDDLSQSERTLRQACSRIAPVWPLERFVAVNPYLGLTDHEFGQGAARLEAVAGVRTTMPADYYLEALDHGRMDRDDLLVALRAGGASTSTSADADDVERLLQRARSASADLSGASVPTVARVATATTGLQWSDVCTERLSSWAAAYFDEGQAMWRAADSSAGPYTSWKEEASIDRTPEVMGLRGFRAAVRALPDDPTAAAHQALAELGLSGSDCEIYAHALLLQLGGWSAHAARIVWDLGLAGQPDDTLLELLSVLLVWDALLLRTVPDDRVRRAWAEALESIPTHGSVGAADVRLADELVLQDAFDRGEQRRLIAQFAAASKSSTSSGAASAVAPSAQSSTSSGAAATSGAASSARSSALSGAASPRASAQAVFCIDVRSEVFRRHLESVDPLVETIGFAGFFGMAIDYVPLAHDRPAAQFPVLLTAGQVVGETLSDPEQTEAAVGARRLAHQVRRSWKAFKMGAISCFSFVGPVGLLYLPKMFSDSFGMTRPVRRPEDEGLGRWAAQDRGPSLAPGLTTGSGSPSIAGIAPTDRVDLAEGALRGMSLTEGFAPLVLITGHGATTANNPYDTGLDCGACGGHTGESNARVAAAILNDPDVRRGLVSRGLLIPDGTWFVAALHDTTTDQVQLFDTSHLPASHHGALTELSDALVAAGQRTRNERSGRMDLAGSRSVDDQVLRRSTDWSQVRPEWGLAGCRTFVAAPRQRTKEIDLGGRSFLHSYDWNADDGFGVLELIMTAPVVVASWISLQYYASTVDNTAFGSGNKTLHNVVGRIGVLEGNTGDLRVGLPWQSVHDGEQLQHEPLRLNVVIEAPREAMSDVLAAHEGVRALFDHGWMRLLSMDESGAITHRYAGDLQWEAVEV